MAHRVEQSPEQARTREFEVLPERLLRPAPGLREVGERQKQGAVGKIRTAGNILDAVKDNRAGSIEQHLVLVGVELADRKTASARQPAKCIREPRGQGRQVVKCEHMAVIGSYEEIAFLARQGSNRGDIGIDE